MATLTLTQAARSKAPLVIWTDADYKGEAKKFGEGSFGSLDAGVERHNDRISSFRILPFTSVTFYRDSNFKGPSRTFASAASGLAVPDLKSVRYGEKKGPFMNDDVSSVKVAKIAFPALKTAVTKAAPVLRKVIDVATPATKAGFATRTTAVEAAREGTPVAVTKATSESAEVRAVPTQARETAAAPDDEEEEEEGDIREPPPETETAAWKTGLIVVGVVLALAAVVGGVVAFTKKSKKGPPPAMKGPK